MEQSKAPELWRKAQTSGGRLRLLEEGSDFWRKAQTKLKERSSAHALLQLLIPDIIRNNLNHNFIVTFNQGLKVCRPLRWYITSTLYMSFILNFLSWFFWTVYLCHVHCIAKISLCNLVTWSWSAGGCCCHHFNKLIVIYQPVPITVCLSDHVLNLEGGGWVRRWWKEGLYTIPSNYTIINRPFEG